MSNMRIILYQTFGVFFVFFITSVAWGQQESQNESLSSESETIKIIREIHQLEKNLIKEMYELDKQMRGYVDKSIKDIDKQISDMNGQISDMNRELGSLKATIEIIMWILGIIAIPIALYILSLTFPGLLFWRKDKTDVPEGITDSSGEPFAENNTINQTNPQETQ